MSFTTPCYIHRNTIELRNKLRDLGYKVFPDIFNHPCLSAEDGLVIPADGNNRNRLYDCGTNDDLFLAIAALRNDSDYMQWFTDGNKWILCDREDWIDMYSTLCYGKGHDYQYALDKCLKATVSELITYLKNEEQ